MKRLCIAFLLFVVPLFTCSYNIQAFFSIFLFEEHSEDVVRMFPGGKFRYVHLFTLFVSNFCPKVPRQNLYLLCRSTNSPPFVNRSMVIHWRVDQNVLKFCTFALCSDLPQQWNKDWARIKVHVPFQTKCWSAFLTTWLCILPLHSLHDHPMSSSQLEQGEDYSCNASETGTKSDRYLTVSASAGRKWQVTPPAKQQNCRFWSWPWVA